MLRLKKYKSKKVDFISMGSMEDFLSIVQMTENLIDEGMEHQLGLKIPKTAHYYKVPILALLLAKMEGKSDDDVLKVLIVALFHDLHEILIGDIDYPQSVFIGRDLFEKLEEKAKEEILKKFPDELRDFVKKAFEEVESREDLRNIVKDADKLDYMMRAKKLEMMGIKESNYWFKNLRILLRTESGKKIGRTLEGMDINTFWKKIQDAILEKALKDVFYR